MEKAGEEAAFYESIANNTKFDIEEIDDEVKEIAKELAALQQYQAQLLQYESKNAVYAVLYNRLPRELREGWAKP